jgi:hypothetical protein
MKLQFVATIVFHTLYMTHNILTCLLTYLLHGAVLPEKLTGFQLVKKSPALYGTRRFITAFTRARHLSLSSASLIQSKPPHPTSWITILILSSYLRLGLPSSLFPSGFPTKTLYMGLKSTTFIWRKLSFWRIFAEIKVDIIYYFSAILFLV